MAFRIREVGGRTGTISRDGRGDDHAITYEVYDPSKNGFETNYLQDAYAHLVANIPASWYGAARDSIPYRQHEKECQRIEFDVSYKSITPPDSAIRWSWDTTGGTVKIKTSRNTARYAIAGRTAPDHKGAIGVTDKEVEGVDIVIPALKLTATFRHEVGSATVNSANLANYLKTLARCTGATNNGTWQSFAQGELLFLGSTGEFIADKETEAQYHFAASQNATGLTIGDIAGIAKKGHQYLWISFEPTEDTGANNLVTQRPVFCYVEDVYREVNFADLAIG